MRSYAAVAPTFWTGPTGREIRKAGRDAQLLALYLLTNPHSNSLGLYYLPLDFITHETALTTQGASKALARVMQTGFCAYDGASEMVWVYEMARRQLTLGPEDSLRDGDKRIPALNREYKALPNCAFLKEFYDKYGDALHLDGARKSTGKASPLQGASKGHASFADGSSLSLSPSSSPSPSLDSGPLKGHAFDEFWQAYPRKVGKAAARKAWDKVTPDLSAVLKALEWQTAQPDWNRDSGQFIPHPATWLNQHRWEDEPTEIRESTQPQGFKGFRDLLRKEDQGGNSKRSAGLPAGTRHRLPKAGNTNRNT